MPVTVVVGGQFGSEGKGKAAHWFARTLGASTAVRVGGPNSGHTVITPDGSPLIFKQLPTAAILPDVVCALPAGSYIDVGLLLNEVKAARLPPHRLLVDPNAVVVTERELDQERHSTLKASVGSTLSGTGAAVLARASRDGNARLARDDARLRDFVRSTTPHLRERLNNGERVLVEGTQGFGLSVLHSPHYPFATSRDTTAAGFVAEAGLSPLDVDDVVLVIRSFPIRVAGNSGPLPNEITWDTVSRESGCASVFRELTSVTRAVRRVARFDATIVRDAIAHNAPTRIVLNHLDHVDAAATPSNGHTAKSLAYIREVGSALQRHVTHVGLGPAHIEELST
jgi:adenylosuccinate synthase